MATVYAPTGKDAVSLTCAILDIAGDTGHRIVSEEHIQDREATAHAPVVHMDLPEGLTPCGPGTQDVTTATCLDRVTCLECLRNLARTRHGDVLRLEDMVEPGDEVPDPRR